MPRQFETIDCDRDMAMTATQSRRRGARVHDLSDKIHPHAAPPVLPEHSKWLSVDSWRIREWSPPQR
jgi:hypothetical protein